jgi:hypothetical protein
MSDHSAGLTHRPREASAPSGRLTHGQPQPSGLSTLAIIGRRSLASSSFVLASALTGAPAAGADPRPRGGTETSSREEIQHNSQSRAITRPPGQDSTLC